MYSVYNIPHGMGFPIRTSTDQGLFAPPRSFSQRTTSFIASLCQGILEMPLIHLIESWIFLPVTNIKYLLPSVFSIRLVTTWKQNPQKKRLANIHYKFKDLPNLKDLV